MRMAEVVILMLDKYDSFTYNLVQGLSEISEAAVEVVRNAGQVVLIELLCATRALSWRLEEQPGLRLGLGTGAAHALLSARLDQLDDGATPAAQLASLQGVLPELTAAVVAASGTGAGP